jgi:hypothetical protein
MIYRKPDPRENGSASAVLKCGCRISMTAYRKDMSDPLQKSEEVNQVLGCVMLYSLLC